ncbi:MAG: pilus assembly protein [Caldilineaceae bacterium]|nr:pilus assembly protein [Caldilineaceae bacterium]
MSQAQSVFGKVDRLNRGERGQSLIEMAVIMPLIIIIMVGIFDFGRVIHAYVVVVNATREAAIAGGAESLTDNDLRALVNSELQRGGVNSGTSTVLVTYASSGSPPAQTLTVDLSYEIPLVISVLTFQSVTVHSQARMITFW